MLRFSGHKLIHKFQNWLLLAIRKIYFYFTILKCISISQNEIKKRKKSMSIANCCSWKTKKNSEFIVGYGHLVFTFDMQHVFQRFPFIGVFFEKIKLFLFYRLFRQYMLAFFNALSGTVSALFVLSAFVILSNHILSNSFLFLLMHYINNEVSH